MSIFAATRLSLKYCRGCHGNDEISDYQDGFIFEEHYLLHLSGPIESVGINMKCS